MKQNRLETEDAVRRSHGRLDIETLDLLPVLGEQRNQKVDGEDNVGLDLGGSHGDVGDGDTEAESLLGLELELDGGLGGGDLLSDVLRSAEGGRELTSLVKTGTDQTGNQTNEGRRSEESVIRVGHLLDEFLVLLELLEIILRDARDAESLGILQVLGITDNGDLILLLGGNRQANRAGKTLLLVGIVVLKGDLEFDRLDESTLLLSRMLENSSNRLRESISAELRH